MKAGRLLDHDGGNHDNPAVLEVEQIALAQIPADEIGRVPEGHALRFPTGEPGKKNLRRMVIVPARAEDHRVKAVEPLLGGIPGNAGDRDISDFERPLDVQVAVGDVRPGETCDEADAAAHSGDSYVLASPAKRRFSSSGLTSSLWVDRCQL